MRGSTADTAEDSGRLRSSRKKASRGTKRKQEEVTCAKTYNILLSITQNRKAQNKGFPVRLPTEI